MCESCDLADRVLELINSAVQHDMPEAKKAIADGVGQYRPGRHLDDTTIQETLVDWTLAALVAKHMTRSSMRHHISQYLDVWVTILQTRLILELDHGGKHGQTDPDAIPRHKRP